jgi:hypothetical protein
MTKTSPETLGAFIVAMHDQEGFPMELGFQMAAENGQRPMLFDCLHEAAARDLSHGFVKEMSGYFKSNFKPTEVEDKAIHSIMNYTKQ